MKYTTVIAAGLAAGVSADEWSSWASSTEVADVTCPATVTQTVTKSAECAEVTSEVYETTITVEAPKTKTITIYADGKQAPELWEQWTWAPAPAPPAPTHLPHGCVPKVVTETETAWVKKAGWTTTVTGSILFVGAGECVAPETITFTAKGPAPTAGWSGGNWGSGSTGPDTGSPSWGSGSPDSGDKGSPGWGSGSSGPGPDSGSGSWGSGSEGGHGGDWGNWNHGKAPVFSTAPEGWKIPISEKIVGTDIDKWILPVPTNTKSYSAPVYTKQPDGSYGYEWGSWDGGNGSGDGGDGSGSGGKGDGSGDGSGDGGKGGDGGDGSGDGGNGGKGDGGDGSGNGSGSGGNGGSGGQTGPGKNSTTPVTPSKPGYNVTAGDPGSNVTKPILPLAEGSCNSAGSRGQWCDGKSASSNYYEDYFSGKTCRADLTISHQSVNFDGTPRPMLVFNGQMPGPLIECNWGDIIEVTVHNALGDDGASIHWHGFRQLGTNDMDGVPGVTECPIAPGDSRVYTFHASSYGSSWYHSHKSAQYGDGLYGPIIIHGPATSDYDGDMGIVAIQDTFEGTAAEQNSIIAHQGPKSTLNYLLNGHNVKADLSGGQHTLWQVESGKKYLFRILNAAAQNMFSVSLDKHTMTVIAADFVPICPYTTNWLNIGIGQRYDVVIKMDQKVDSYFFRAVTQTQCPSSCTNSGLGNANGIVAYKGVSEKPFNLPTSTTDKVPKDFYICDDEPLASLVPYVPMGAGSSSAFAASASKLPASIPALVQTTDDGKVYKWFLNNGAININFTQPSLMSLAQGVGLNTTLISNPIVLKQKQDWVYFVIQNQFFASHPIHLHGHDFSILGQGEGNFDITSQGGSLNFANPMRRDTAMLKGAPPGPPSPTGYTVIAFQTDNPGAWLMHCHIIWHVDEGLALQWIERPDDISTDKYVDSGFKQECAAYADFEAANPSARKTSGEAGLKKRTFFDEQMARINGFQFDDVVRRGDSVVKRYIDTMHQKRGLGDGYHPRHFNRRS